MFLLITKCGKKQQKRKHILLRKTEPRLENFYETKQSLRISFCWPLYCKYMAARAVTKCRGAEHTPLLTRASEQASSFSNHHQKISISQGTPCFVKYNIFGNCYVRLSPNIFQKLWVSWTDVLLLDKINFLSASTNFSFHLGQMALISVATIDRSTVPV